MRGSKPLNWHFVSAGSSAVTTEMADRSANAAAANLAVTLWRIAPFNPPNVQYDFYHEDTKKIRNAKQWDHVTFWLGKVMLWIGRASVFLSEARRGKTNHNFQF